MEKCQWRVLRPFPKSILDPKNKKLAHYNCHILKKINQKAELLLQEEKIKNNSHSNRSRKYEKIPANPKLLRPLPKSIIGSNKQKLAY